MINDYIDNLRCLRRYLHEGTVAPDNYSEDKQPSITVLRDRYAKKSN